MESKYEKLALEIVGDYPRVYNKESLPKEVRIHYLLEEDHYPDPKLEIAKRAIDNLVVKGDIKENTVEKNQTGFIKDNLVIKTYSLREH